MLKGRPRNESEEIGEGFGQSKKDNKPKSENKKKGRKSKKGTGEEEEEE